MRKEASNDSVIMTESGLMLQAVFDLAVLPPEILQR